MDLWRETEGKLVHDPLYARRPYKTSYSLDKTMMAAALETAGREKRVVALGPIIVGAGPSGLAVAACLRQRGIPSLVIERSSCIASLWKLKSYDRLRLHLPKQFCELPLMPFPRGFPTYPTKQEFLHYLDTYAKRFDIRPVFGEAVASAEYDEETRLWRVWTAVDAGGDGKMVTKAEYASPWLVVATGENAEAVVPAIDGAEKFKGSVLHTSSYKSGMEFNGKRVLVVGCGNSGMEVCLDLYHHEAMPSLVVRDAVHVLPREMLGGSTFALAMWLLKWLPARTVDRLLLLVSRFMLGDTASIGLKRPQLGPLELKALCGKTPVLDVGTLAKIKSGGIKVRPAIRRLQEQEAEFIDGRLEEFDAIVFATGYKSNVPSWLKEGEFFSEKDGLPKRPFPNGWKGERGLYAVGFTKRGLLGASMDAMRIAEDIERCWRTEEREQKSFFSQANLHN